jgi:hypothetical protein
MRPTPLLPFVTVLAGALVVGACGSDSNLATPPVAYLVRGGDMGPRAQNVSVHQDGAAMTTAEVTVNGVALRHAAEGRYSGELAADLPAGGPLALEVRVGGSVVTATGAVPGLAELTAPSGNAIVPPPDPIVVEWTSPVNPDRFVVMATPESGPVQQFSASGAARSLTIAAGALPEGQSIQLEVAGYDDGTFSGPFEQGSIMSIRGLGTSVTIQISSEVPARNLLVEGSDMGGRFQNLRVSRSGVGVAGATVTVNGVALNDLTGGSYRVELPQTVPPGGTLALEVRADESTVTAMGAVPEPPAVTAPADGANFDATTGILVEWTSGTNPDRFQVTASYSCGPSCGTGQRFPAAGTARSLTIPAGTLPVEQPIEISVFGYNDGVFSGAFAEGSAMRIRGELGPFPTITISP